MLGFGARSDLCVCFFLALGCSQDLDKITFGCCTVIASLFSSSSSANLSLGALIARWGTLQQSWSLIGSVAALFMEPDVETDRASLM